MNYKLLLAALLVAPLALTACAKKDAATSEQQASSTAQVAESDQTTPEQQAAIDKLDKPVLDEKNTDVPAEKANAPADVATPATEEPAQK